MDEAEKYGWRRVSELTVANVDGQGIVPNVGQ